MYRVLKFGGTSVASATSISRVLDIVEKEAAKGRVILVSSAIAGCTDGLLQLAEGDSSGLAALQKRHQDIVQRLFTGVERRSMLERVEALFTELLRVPAEEIVTYGEILSTTILCAKLEVEGYRTQWLDSRKLVIKDNEPLTYSNILSEVAPSKADIFVAPGFICGTPDGCVSTLGRGGSDYSAALYAAAVKAESLQIWTDVPGIMTANPKQVPAARTVPRMSYASALDMASHGAKVLYAPTVAPAMTAGIDIEIRNTFAPEGKYTVIGAEPDASRWIGVASQGDCIRVVGTARGEEGLLTAEEALREAGIAALEMKADGGSLDLRVRPAVLESCLKALHRAFFQTQPLQEVNLLVAGEGAVAQAFFQMVERSARTVEQRTGKMLRIVGRSNSRRFGMDPGGHPELNREGDYIDAILSEATKGAVFVDLTNSESLYKRYTDLLQAGLSIVSSNRRSFAVPYTEYAAIKAAARENGVALRYETTVGAALPVLESIARGANSCDEVLSLEAVVSCTLNQILGDYRPGGASFASLVRRAQAAGLTEEDPRLDLGGKDALRKLLILAREAGVALEETQVKVDPVVPEALFQGSVEDFYQGLEAAEEDLANAAREAESRGFRRRFVASLEKTAQGYEARIGIREVPPVHPAYYLRGTENAIVIRSAFHPYPLVIQGPGEGAREAASSILNDILR